MPEKYIIDGYNVIFASGALKETAGGDLEAARTAFISWLEDFSRGREIEIEVVFDAAGTDDPVNRLKRSEHLTVIYTARGQTADSYIEREAYMSKDREIGEVAVVTGDYLQQKIILGTGLLRVTPKEFLAELDEFLSRFEPDLKRHRKKPWRVRLDRRISEKEMKKLENLQKKSL
ncbi:MAG: NYN domain-containing protein [Actinobacteria bacterium]|nr:NYN domain-containing protein [Actinomycetota bacterium]